jgi:hypothetical protein
MAMLAGPEYMSLSEDSQAQKTYIRSTINSEEKESAMYPKTWKCVRSGK